MATTREAKRAYERRHRDLFLCKYCSKPAVSSNRCEYHYRKHLAARRRAQDRRGRRFPIHKSLYKAAKRITNNDPF